MTQQNSPAPTTAPTTVTAPTSLTTTTTPSVSSPTWRDALTVTDEVKSWSGFSNLKDPSDAVIQLYNAQKLIGVDKVPKPKEDWKDEQWNDFYGKIGRPSKADEYQYNIDGTLKPLVDETRLKQFNETFHKAGLTKKQAEQVVTAYLQSESGLREAQSKAKEAQSNTEFVNLSKEWGNQFDANIGVAKQALQKFGDPALIQALNNSGLDSNPAIIKFFHKLGMSLSESKAFGVGSGDINSPANAKITLAQRMNDTEWRSALFDKNNPRHEAVVAERAQLYKNMIPN